MKTIQRFFPGAALLAVVLLAGPRVLADSGTTPQFNEVRELLLKHMSGGTEAELNRSAVRGLIAELKGRAELVAVGLMCRCFAAPRTG